MTAGLEIYHRHGVEQFKVVSKEEAEDIINAWRDMSKGTLLLQDKSGRIICLNVQHIHAMTWKP